jgi:hypothetical protein
MLFPLFGFFRKWIGKVFGFMGLFKTFIFNHAAYGFQENKLIGKEKSKKERKRIQLNPVGFWNCASIEPKSPEPNRV